MWTEPKTNWQPDDYINIEDFNRIRDNIEFLKTEADELFGPFKFSFPLSEREEDYRAIPYPDKWNSLVNGLKDIMNNTYMLSSDDLRTYNAYEPYINFEELNRIESLTQEYHEFFIKHRKNIQKLPIVLGGVRIWH